MLSTTGQSPSPVLISIKPKFVIAEFIWSYENFVCIAPASSECSDELAHMRRLVRAFVASYPKVRIPKKKTVQPKDSASFPLNGSTCTF